MSRLVIPACQSLVEVPKTVDFRERGTVWVNALREGVLDTKPKGVSSENSFQNIHRLKFRSNATRSATALKEEPREVHVAGIAKEGEVLFRIRETSAKGNDGTDDARLLPPEGSANIFQNSWRYARRTGNKRDIGRESDCTGQILT